MNSLFILCMVSYNTTRQTDIPFMVMPYIGHKSPLLFGTFHASLFTAKWHMPSFSSSVFKLNKSALYNENETNYRAEYTPETNVVVLWRFDFVITLTSFNFKYQLSLHVLKPLVIFPVVVTLILVILLCTKFRIFSVLQIVRCIRWCEVGIIMLLSNNITLLVKT